MTDHVVIPDTQIKPSLTGKHTKHLTWASNYIQVAEPEKVIILGDWWDMPSLSSWSSKQEAEKQRYNEDIEVGLTYMQEFVHSLPTGTEVHFCEGNHEDRINRYVKDHPEVQGWMSTKDCDVERFGVHRHTFLQPVKLDGVKYSHYFYNANSGRPFANARLMIKATHESCTAGHLQTLDSYMDHIPDSDRFVRGTIAGAFYMHDEEYKGPQGNNHWRGILHKRNVRHGMYDLDEVSMFTLKKDWS